MRTLSLSVVPQTVGCNAKCRFCISKSTFTPDSPIRKIDFGILERACKFSKDCGAQTGIVTGKGEPLLMDIEHLRSTIGKMSAYFSQIDLHTNGIGFSTMEDGEIRGLKMIGLTNVTVSVAHYSPVKSGEVMDADVFDINRTIKLLSSIGFHVRLSCVLAKGYVDGANEIEYFLDNANKLGADSVIFRELWVAGDTCPEKKWCSEHYVPLTVVDGFVKEKGLRKIMDLPWGGVYDYDGIAVNASECEYRDQGFVKSFILLPDNRLYYSWASKASRLW